MHGANTIVYKVGWGTMGFIGENLGRTKGLKYLIIFFSYTFFYNYGVLMGIKRG
jgi:hypothetical protein